MNAKKDIDSRMRELEYFHQILLIPGAWTIVRVDGRTFSRFTAQRFEKPFDVNFRDMMVMTSQALLEDLQGIYCCTHSDEISVLFPPSWNIFNRKLEKIVSISAGLASAAFTHACGTPAHFDSRVWMGTNKQTVIDYFQWRQDDAARCALHGWCYWTLRKQGKTARQATRALEHKGVDYKNELLFREGINFNDLPRWQRRGTGLYWHTFEKQGYDPLRQTSVTTTRRRIIIDYDLSMREDYERFLCQLLEGFG